MENNWILRIIKNERFIGLSAFASIISIPLSFVMAEKFKIGIFIVFAAAFIVLVFNILDILKNIQNDFYAIKIKLSDLNADFKCKNNCKEEVKNDIKIVHDIVSGITNKVDRPAEKFELIDLSSSKLILLIYENSSKLYKLVVKGSCVQDIQLDNAGTDKEYKINRMLVKKNDKASDSKVESYFEFSSEIGVNIGVIELTSIKHYDDLTVDIDVIFDSKKIYTCKDIKVKIV